MLKWLFLKEQEWRDAMENTVLYLRHYDQDFGLTGRLRTRVYAGSVTAIPVGADEIWRGSSLRRAGAASGCRDLCSHLRERWRPVIRKRKKASFLFHLCLGKFPNNLMKILHPVPCCLHWSNTRRLLGLTPVFWNIDSVGSSHRFCSSLQETSSAS